MSMKRWYYTYAGLRVVSELRIPEWSVFEEPQPFGEAEVFFTLKDTPDGQPAWAENHPFISLEEYRFYTPEAGYYRVREGREIVVKPAPGAMISTVQLFLLGSAWSALCYQRGLSVFHASAVQVEDEAVAFCAHQGMGKSTMAAWLAVRGHALVSDDLTRFDIPVQGQLTIYPSAPRLKLWRDALSALEWSSEELERDHFRFEKFYLPWTGVRQQQPLPLRAIYLLEWGEWNITRLSGGTALHRFVSAATHRGALLEPMGQLGAYWHQCLELVSRVPVWELKRPRDLPAMGQTVDLLASHWASIKQEKP
ncbi:MAG: hypothetical protein ACYSRP_07535 [Planctomycetota bacterium]|jgi:hypothetical protein